MKGKYKRLTFNKLREKRNKDLCFKCDERYSPGHKYKSLKLNVIIVMEDENEETDMENQGENEEYVVEEVELDRVELQVETIAGLTGPKSMKLVGQILREKVVILIDSGATHNFITKELIKKCNLTVEPTETYAKIMENKKRINCSGKCVDVSVKLHELEIIGEFMPMELGSLNLILGVQ